MAEVAIITTCMHILVPSIAEAVVTTSVLTLHVLVITPLLTTLPVLHGTREWIMAAMTTTVATTMASTIVEEATTTIAAIPAVVPTRAAMVAATTTAIVVATSTEVATIALHTPSQATAVARCVSRRTADLSAYKAARCVAQAAPPVQQALRTSAAAVRIAEAAPLTAEVRMAEVRVEVPTEADHMVVDIRDAKSEKYGNRQEIHQYIGGRRMPFGMYSG